MSNSEIVWTRKKKILRNNTRPTPSPGHPVVLTWNPTTRACRALLGCCYCRSFCARRSLGRRTERVWPSCRWIGRRVGAKNLNLHKSTIRMAGGEATTRDYQPIQIRQRCFVHKLQRNNEHGNRVLGFSPERPFSHGQPIWY